jgi:hypothetical protein
LISRDHDSTAPRFWFTAQRFDPNHVAVRDRMKKNVIFILGPKKNPGSSGGDLVPFQLVAANAVPTRFG